MPIQSGAILELNAFSSVFCRTFAQGKSDLDCVGLCPNPQRYDELTQSKGTALNVTFRTDAPDHICYPENTFRLVYSIFANRLASLPTVLSDVHRVLVDDGQLLLYILEDWSGLSKEWVGLGRLSAPKLYWRLRKDRMSPEAQQALLDSLKSSPFGGGQIQTHGPFLRIELRK